MSGWWIIAIVAGTVVATLAVLALVFYAAGKAMDY